MASGLESSAEGFGLGKHGLVFLTNAIVLNVVPFSREEVA